MILKIKIVVWVLCLGFIPLANAQTNSVLASGDWYKFSVETDGIYKINADLLRKAGINPDQIDPRNIRIYTGSTGMLPQANSQPRIQDLQEISISVSGEGDGKFNSEDFILFFGQGADKFNFDLQRQVFKYENNLFTDKNYYFLTIATSAGKRIGTNQNIAGSFPLIQEYDDFAFYETEKYNLLKSGRQWFGEQFDVTTEATIRFDISGIVANSPLKFTSHVMAQSISDCAFKVFFNSNQILDQPVLAIPNYKYGIKGQIRIDTVSLNSTTVGAAAQSNQDIKYQFSRGTTAGLSVGYLDYFLFSFKRKLAQYGSQTAFTSSNSLSNNTSSFEISSATSKSNVWNITDVANANAQTTVLNGDKLTFSLTTDILKKFVVFNPDNVTLPTFEKKISNQNVHALTPPQLIIISHPAFEKEAERLAAHRQSKSGITTAVVTTDEIYHEYASGKPDFTAIRDFVRDLYKKSGSQLKNILLFGRGSYDYKDRVFNNTNFVPIYESVNSLSPLETYSSDDYYALLEDNEGDWNENPAANSSMDVGVGRLPVKTSDEAKAVVDKLIAYDIEPKGAGAWRKNILFVADDGDGSLHQDQSNQLAKTIDQLNPEFDANRLFLGSYKQITLNTGQYSPDASKTLDLAIRKGQSIVNYTGHGSEKVWMQEQIISETSVLNLKNTNRYPLFVTATCEFGRNDDPFIISSAEHLLFQPKGGGIGLVTTARPVNSSTNFTLNKAFYTSLFTQQNNSYRDIGSVFRETKNNSISGTANRNFSLLCDPSLKLNWSTNQVVATNITTASGSSTLKSLSKVTIQGEIRTNGAKRLDYNGTVTVIVFDKVQNLSTLNDADEVVNPPSPPYNYTQRTNKLFEGSASVVNGTFQLDLVLPQNIIAGVDKGKISYYAHAATGEDAFGYTNDIQIGGTEPSPVADTTPPQIKLFLGDTTFISGGLAASNTKMIALLSDESGISTSSINPQNNIIAKIDGTKTFIVNDYYEANQDNFKKGTVIFPLDTLRKGKHTLTLTASDTYNNSKTSSVDFVVTEGNGISIEQFTNFPNPVVTGTKFWFTHNRPGEDLQATLLIYNLAGQLVLEKDYTITESSYQVILPEWNIEEANGGKLGHGLYVARLFVRSLLDGSNNEKNAKFILLN